MKNALAQYSTWRLILPAFIAFVVCIYFFQKAQNEMSVLAGEEVVIIDMMPSYDKAKINDFFIKIKPEGRAIHKQTTGVVDMVFPFAYGLLFILLSAFFLKKIAGPNSNWIYLSLFPVLLMLVDFKENLNTLDLLKSFPNLDADQVNSASKITGIKSMLTNLSMAMPLILGLVWLVKLVIGKKKV